MQAQVCERWGGPETLILKELPDPTPKRAEVVIRIHAAGVNFPDVLIIQKKYQAEPSLPFIPGAEVAGEVISVGSEVKTLRVGDHVVALCQTGGFATHIALPETQCLRIPTWLDMNTAAALLIAYGTSWHALHERGVLESGETLLVLGASGGVGLAAIQIGKLAGARVVAAASTDLKCALCIENGADMTINYSTEDLRSGIRRTCSDGPDVIFDPVGDKFTETAFRSIRRGGRHLVLGFAGGQIPALPLNLVLLKNAALVGVFWGDSMKQDHAAWLSNFDGMLAAIKEGKLKPLISRTYSLADVPNALLDMASRQVTGKVVVTP